jgi:hypothetical protein
MQLIAQKEAADFVKTGAKEFRQNSEIRLTPGAKDIFTEAGIKVVFDSGAASPASAPAPAGDYAPVPAPPPYSADDIRLFNSKEANEIKEQICDIGRRIWAANTAMAMVATSPRASARIASSARRPASAKAS